MRSLEIQEVRHTAWSDWLSTLEFLRGAARDGELVALRDMIQQSAFDRARKQLNRDLRGYLDEVVESPHWRQRFPKYRRKILRSMEQSDPDWFAGRIKKHLPQLREAAVARLREDDAWLRRKLRSAYKRRFLQRLGLGRTPPAT